MHLHQDFPQGPGGPALDVGPEAHGFAADAGADDVFQAVEGAAADEQDVGGIHLDELLLRMLAAALGRHRGMVPFYDLQQGLLHPSPETSR